ncbi:hypothetical protein ACYOEI_19700 [Singulisphaera rosea]
MINHTNRYPGAELPESACQRANDQFTRLLAWCAGNPGGRPPDSDRPLHALGTRRYNLPDPRSPGFTAD